MACVDKGIARDLGKKPTKSAARQQNLPDPKRKPDQPSIKSLSSLPVRKPLVVQKTVGASSSKSSVLPSRCSSTLSSARFAPFSRRAHVIDKSKHTSIVISENEDPNVVVSGIDDPTVVVDNPQCDASFSIPAKPPDKVDMSATIASTQGVIMSDIGASRAMIMSRSRILRRSDALCFF
ncbi:hypothetical protein V6N13_037958 [Hibiscus sabdariffa]|uniref:Uncharacterized protein n=1 Tax=Hibiscus sabdariffa TaxID=183260 RepID=A0ABR2S3I7_9ROSI